MTAPQQGPHWRFQGLLVDEQGATLVDDLLWRGTNVLLTPTWIAQAQKADSQSMFMAVERDTLWPMVKRLLADLLSALTDDGARIWAGTALALLNEGLDATRALRRGATRLLSRAAVSPQIGL